MENEKNYDNFIDNDSLNNLLNPEPKKEEKHNLDVLKELFVQKNIESKTELTVQQIILINQKRTIAKLLDWNTLEETLNDFMLLMVSNKRRGRAEFVDGFKSERESEIKQQGGFFGNVGEKLGFK